MSEAPLLRVHASSRDLVPFTQKNGRICYVQPREILSMHATDGGGAVVTMKNGQFYHLRDSLAEVVEAIKALAEPSRITPAEEQANED